MLKVADDCTGHVGLIQHPEVISNAQIASLEKCVVHSAEALHVRESTPRFAVIWVETVDPGTPRAFKRAYLLRHAA